MFGPGPTFPAGPGGAAASGGGSSGFSGRDIVWVDLRFPGGVGNNGTEELPYNTANLGLNAVPNGGTLVMVGGDASTEAGVNIGARSLAVRGFGGQTGSGGLLPILPTLTYAITSGTQRLAFHNASVALVHSSTVASLTQFFFEFCPTVTLTAGGDASPVYWFGDGTCTFSGSGGPAQFCGGTIAGYVANSAGAIIARGCNVTSDLTSTSTITILEGCTFGALSITAPTISIDATSYKNAVTAGVSFSSTPVLLVATGTPVDTGTANSAGTGNLLALATHVHNTPFSAVNAAFAAANATININGQKITGSGAPTSSTDLVTKAYADAAAIGLKVKTPAVAVATANQATLTGTAQTIDGVALNTIGQRVLLTAQTTATQNGLWVIAAGAWTRPTDFATGSGAAQSYVLVTGGTLNAGSAYYCTNATGSDVVDTNNLTWTLFTQSASVTAGAGLTKTGNTLDVVATDATIVVAADSIGVGVIGNANLADNTIALARIANAGAQFDFMMRVSASGGPWQDGTLAQAKSALGIFMSGAIAPVRAATTANITLSGTQTVDGVALVANDRCLVKNQTTAANNGVYAVASGAWTRTTDATTTGQLVGGLLVPISEGTANGNQAAQLTTDDPITIGSTSLTFTMGRVAALGSVAPLDITDGSAQIGTSQFGAPIDHVHHLGFTALAAVLAVASSSIAVNSQKITGLATPTVSTDAATKGYVDSTVSTAIGATVAPANPGDNGKIVYANAGALAYRAGVTTSNANQLAFAAEVTNSNLQFEHNTIIAKAKDSTGAQYNAILRWGVTSDELKIGGGGSLDLATMRFTGRASVQYIWEAATGTAIKSLTSQGMTVTPVATTGAVLPALRVTDAAHTALTASTERNSVLFDFAQTRQFATGALTTQRSALFNAPTYSFVGASTITTAATVSIGGAPIAGTNATITQALALLVEGGAIGFTTSAARAGFVRTPNSNTPILAGRNSGGTADIGAVAVATDNAVYVGDSTNAVAVYIQTAGNVSFRPTGSGGDVYSFSSTLANFRGTSAQFTTTSAGSAATSGIGLLRFAGSPGDILSTRNYDNTGDQEVLNVSGDGSTFSDISFGDSGTKGHNSLYLRSKTQAVIQLAGSNDYVFNATYADWTSRQIRFGASPSAIGLLNFSNNATVMSGKDSGGTDRNLLVWTSGNIFQIGSGNITSVQLQSTPGNTWTFGATAAFAGVEHNLASSGFISFTGTHAGSALIRGPANTAFMAGTDGSGHDLTLVSTDSSNNAIFGMTTFAGTGGATIIRGTDNGSGGVTLTATSSGPSTRSVVFSTTALTVPVTIYLSAGNVVNYQHAVTLLTARNSTNTLDLNVLDWGVVANDTLRIGVGGKIQLANALTGFYGATPVAKPTVSGSRTATTGSAAAALTSVITALANMGLVTDSSTP